MASGMWPSVSGALAQSQAVDTVANNLANMNTDGYKKDVSVFKEYLSTLERQNAPTGISPRPIKDKDLYPLDGKDQTFVIRDGTYTDFRQGHLKVTQSPLDIAIDGPGFFEVSTPAGIRYTRHGSFKLAKDGQLVTTEGYPVLASNAGGLASALPPSAVQPSQGRLLTQGGVAAGPVPPDVVARYIYFQSAGNLGSQISVSEEGGVYAGEQRLGQLGIAEFKDPNKLRKQGDRLFINADPTNLSADLQKSILRQGMVETSNVSPVDEMTKLIQANRMFEQDLKAIKAYDHIMEKESNDLGKL